MKNVSETMKIQAASHPVRKAILRNLPACQKLIADRLNYNYAEIGQHLSILIRAGYVERSKLDNKFHEVEIK